MNNFFTGVVATATVLGSVVGLIAFVRSRTVVRIDVRRHPFRLPPRFEKPIEKLVGHVGYRGLPRSKVDDAAQPDDDSTVGVIETLLQSFNTLGTRYAQGSYLEIEVKNPGHQLATSVELSIPGAVYYRLARQAQDEQAIDGRLSIPEVRPGETVSVHVWTSGINDWGEVTAYQSKGRPPRVQKFKMVSPRWAAFAEIAPPLVLAIVLTIVIMVLAFLTGVVGSRMLGG